LSFQLKKFTKDFSYTFFFNIFSMIVSGVLVFLVPKFLGVVEYGYWQLYILYCTFFNFLSFGITEGVYLRYGGKEYSNIQKSLFTSQFWVLVIFEIIFMISISYGYVYIYSQSDKAIIIFLVCLATIITIPRGFLAYTLQATGRIRSCMSGYFLERCIYFCLVIFLLLMGVKQFEIIILADIIGKAVSLIFLVKVCKEIVINQFATKRVLFIELQKNIGAGSNLLLANISSLLIIGIVRFSIEDNWGIAAFGKVTLTLSISNMILSFFSAISLVLFPMLKKIPEEHKIKIYYSLSNAITIASLGLLLLYFPLQLILVFWIPNYSESLIYLGFLLPLCLYESKMTLLFNTYLKTYRREKALLRINIFSVLLSVFVSYVGVVHINNLNFLIFSILFLLAFRSTIAQLYLSKLLKVSVTKDIIIESIAVFLFIFITWEYKGIYGFMLYFTIYLIYVLVKKNYLFSVIKNIKHKVLV
jgi:O-antigen/teichoic acid export membrane protein